MVSVRIANIIINGKKGAYGMIFTCGKEGRLWPDHKNLW